MEADPATVRLQLNASSPPPFPVPAVSPPQQPQAEEERGAVECADAPSPNRCTGMDPNPLPLSSPASIVTEHSYSFIVFMFPGRPRIDGKEFFRQARTRLSYEQFGAFLANIKEFNAQKQSGEDTLSKAEEIFGTEHKDLYISFQNMLNRNQS